MKRLIIVPLLFVLSSCAAPIKNIQPQINSLVTAQHFERALHFLGDNPSVYGPHNELLYWLDRGMAFHLAGRYKESIGAFETAKKKYDELYTRSISQAAATWVTNDNAADYHGDDHEFVMVNIMQALNFAALGDIDEALVEARDVDQKLNMINARYKADQKNVYKDDAFARFLSGILWQAEGSAEGYNDAFIAYSRAMDVYEKDYHVNYQVLAPEILKENLKSMKIYMDQGTRPRQDKAEVYVFELTGYAPVKTSDSFPIPLDSTHLTKIAFPKYSDRFTQTSSSLVVALANGKESSVDTQLGQNIGAIARKIMDGRKVAIMAKAGVRPLAKYAIEKVAESQVRGSYGDLPADVLNILGNVYNFATEEPDLRTWQTMPNEIRVARMTLEAGTYEIFIEDLDESKAVLERRSLGTFTLKAGDKRFLVSRGFR